MVLILWCGAPARAEIDTQVEYWLGNNSTNDLATQIGGPLSRQLSQRISVGVVDATAELYFGPQFGFEDFRMRLPSAQLSESDRINAGADGYMSAEPGPELVARLRSFLRLRAWAEFDAPYATPEAMAREYAPR